MTKQSTEKRMNSSLSNMTVKNAKPPLKEGNLYYPKKSVLLWRYVENSGDYSIANHEITFKEPWLLLERYNRKASGRLIALDCSIGLKFLIEGKILHVFVGDLEEGNAEEEEKEEKATESEYSFLELSQNKIKDHA